MNDRSVWEPITAVNAQRLRSRAVLGRGRITGMDWSPDGQMLAVSSMCGLWLYLRSAPGSGVLMPDGGRYGRMLFSPDGRLLAAARSDGTVVLWDMATRTVVHELWTERYELVGMAFSPDGGLLAAYGYEKDNDYDGEGTLRIFAVRSGEQVGVRDEPRWATEIAFSPDGAVLAYARIDNRICLWDVATQRALTQLDPPSRAREMEEWTPTTESAIPFGDDADRAHDDHAVALSFGRDGSRLCALSYHAQLYTWSLPEGALLTKVSLRSKNTHTAAFGPGGLMLAQAPSPPYGSASAQRDQPKDAVQLWNPDTRQRTGFLQGHAGTIDHLAFRWNRSYWMLRRPSPLARTVDFLPPVPTTSRLCSCGMPTVVPVSLRCRGTEPRWTASPGHRMVPP